MGRQERERQIRVENRQAPFETANKPAGPTPDATGRTTGTRPISHIESAPRAGPHNNPLAEGHCQLIMTLGLARPRTRRVGPALTLSANARSAAVAMSSSRGGRAVTHRAYDRDSWLLRCWDRRRQWCGGERGGGGGCEGVSVFELVDPSGWDWGGAEKAAGDGAGGVGVVASVDESDECVFERGRLLDGPGGGRSESMTQPVLGIASIGVAGSMSRAGATVALSLFARAVARAVLGGWPLMRWAAMRL